jgi:TonB family protein
MNTQAKPKKFGFSFILSIIFHLLLILFIFLHFLFDQLNPPKEEPKKPYLFSPAYLYQPKPMTNITNSNSPEKIDKTEKIKEIQKKEIKNNIIKKMAKQKHEENIPIPDALPKKSLLSATEDFLQENRRQLLTQSAKYEDHVYMIGDQTTTPDPLIRQLAYVLSAHFRYPEIARKFGITGKTIVGMTLYPNGKLHNIQILESSGNIELDHAALYAVNTASAIKNANRYILQPKRFIIGFVFRTYYNN